MNNLTCTGLVSDGAKNNLARTGWYLMELFNFLLRLVSLATMYNLTCTGQVREGALNYLNRIVGDEAMNSPARTGQ